MIDETDREILKILQQNARIPNAEIARQVGMAPSAILERIRKLESRGVIQGYEARLNPEALGLGLLAYVAVRSTDMSSELRTGQLLAAVDGVQEVHHIAGEDCFLIKVRARDARTLGQLLRERIGATGGVVFTRTTIVLETLHETSLLPLDGVVGAMGAIGAVGAMGGAAPAAAAGETPPRGERPDAPHPESTPTAAAAGLAIMATGGAGRPGRS
jgi:Lrp/AsnC family leucine-responsive transcriptional regulator